MRRKTVLLALLAVAAILAMFVRDEPRAEKSDFRLESAAGGYVSLSEFAGRKPVLVVFWASWCPYCNAAVPAINDLQSRFADRLQILAVDFRENRGKVESFMKAKNVTYPVLFDPDGNVARRYRVVGIPTYILFDRSGKIAYFDNVLPPDIERRI